MTFLLLIGLASTSASVLALWVVSQPGRARGARRIGLVAAGVFLTTGLTATGLYVWARSATDSSQFARALAWGSSAFGDQHRFPAREIPAGGEVLAFGAADRNSLTEYRTDDGRTLDQQLADNQTTAFIVLQRDDLVHEQYYNGSSHESLQTSFSVAKSFTATLVGIAIDEEVFGDIDDAVTDYVPELTDRDERYADITLRHLLTMSSGLSFDDGDGPWDDPANTYHGTDLRSAVVDTPRVETAPGEVFDYNDWNVILLGLALERASGMPVAEYAATRLWQPMGAEADGSWSLDSERHGFEKMFVGLNARAMDFARFGWLYLNGGRRGDEQIIPADFVDEATRLDTTTDPAPDYQYLWWIDEERDSYFANGDHGQLIYIDPAAEVIIVRHGTGPGSIDWIPFLGEIVDLVSRREPGR